MPIVAQIVAHVARLLGKLGSSIYRLGSSIHRKVKKLADKHEWLVPLLKKLFRNLEEIEDLIKELYYIFIGEQKAINALAAKVDELTADLEGLTDTGRNQRRVALQKVQAQTVAFLEKQEHVQNLIKQRIQRHGDKVIRAFGKDGNKIIEANARLLIGLKRTLNKTIQALDTLDPQTKREALAVIEAEQREIDAILADVQLIGRNIMAEYLRTYELEKKLRDQSKNPGIWSGDNPLTDAGPVQLIHEAPAKGVPEVAQAWMSLVQPGGHASAAMATQQLVAQTGLIEAAQTGLLEYEKAGKTAAQVVRDAIQEGMQQAENAIVRFATTGKLEFNSFAQSVITDLIRIQVRQNIIGPLGQYAVSFLSGLFNAGGYNFNSAGTMWGNKPVHPNLGAPNSGAPYLIKHRGGVVGAETSVAHRMVRDVAFDYARRPVYGGLASNEVPAILQRGEMVIPRNLVQASQQPPQVEIHFENRGTPQREVGRTVQFDGQRAIVSVILDDMDRNGPIAQTMQRNFALNPAVS